MYFKRAIMESDEEWSTHKKAMDTSEKSIRNVVPVGFPYFHVEWGGKSPRVARKDEKHRSFHLFKAVDTREEATLT